MLSLKKKHASVATEQLEHQRLSSLINSMTDAVIAVDDDFKVVIYNAAALNLLDSNNIKMGDSLNNLLMPYDANNHLVNIQQLIGNLTTPTINRDLRLKYGDTSLINVFISISPVHIGYGTGGRQGYILVMRDITREKSLEEERNEFISVVSHELRTPIAIAEGNISNAEFMVKKTGNIEQTEKALSQAHTQVLFLADMINDLSTLSRAERGTLEVDIDAIDVPLLMKELCTNYESVAAAKNLQFVCQKFEDAVVLQSSKLYVREILQNFITNAIKYTDSGSVTISAQTHQVGILFKISDTGIGINKADQERIYDKFFRSEDYRTRKANGTGLGLYVTMKLARLLHADITLDSELNKGSTFSVYVPDLH